MSSNRPKSLKDKIVEYADAHYPILYIESFEEARIDNIIYAAMKEIRWNNGCEWDAANGFLEWKEQPLTDAADQKSGIVKIKADRRATLPGQLKEMADWSDNDLEPGFFVLKDSHRLLDDPTVIGSLKQLALRIMNENHPLDYVIVIVSSIRYVPKELEKYVTILEMDYPSIEEITAQIHEFARINDFNIDKWEVNKMAVAFKGLTAFEIDNILAPMFVAAATSDSGEMIDYMALIHEQKRQMIMKSGILEMITVSEKADDIGGLENLKEWIGSKAKVFQRIQEAKEFGVDMPKGVLICGVPGCGKSLSAKVIAQTFGVPLLRLDMGKIMGKYVGESEENMRNAIKLAEAISPCVLWIDELEKAFAGIGGEGHEITIRLFGTFLTWMQEKKTPTFVVATANKIVADNKNTDKKAANAATALPPELLRKGRFDEIFYVLLPTEAERRKIFEIHIKKRRAKDFALIEPQLDKLADETDGYSGADIEGVVKDAIEAAFVDGARDVTFDCYMKAIKATQSLSKIMQDEISDMQKICKDRGFKRASK